jgi:hypothetical protein
MTIRGAPKQVSCFTNPASCFFPFLSVSFFLFLGLSGEHQFKFLADGKWSLSPNYCVVDDSVGTTGNNKLQVSVPIGTTAVGANGSRYLDHEAQDDAALKAAIQVNQLNTKHYNTQLSTKYYSSTRPNTMPLLRLLSRR